ncbi:hypothetical protein LPJ66_006959 [Kickxella alabastrina]|uniref:Uncharacterized protein n=1 Tax=Kickxella alabastrina TaxID=61397 RepID=A0ACC1ICN9_9FUNG|nr:hypothetical protein LPJ66_006959 [Kickxella alabastrina]
MSINNDTGADEHREGKFSRIIRKCNDFRSTPAAVLTVSTLAVFADTVVYGLIVPFLPEILQDKLGMSTSANGILFGCFGVGVLIGAPISAYISDRWNIRKWPMIIGLVGLGVTSVLFALANAFWQLVVARLAQGISSGITWAIGLGMIADVYAGGEAMGRAMGIAFSGFTLGYLGGPVLGGVIYGAGGTHAIAIFVAGITVVDLIFRLLLKEPESIMSLVASHSGSSANLELEISQHENILESNLSAVTCNLEQENDYVQSEADIKSLSAPAPSPVAVKKTASIASLAKSRIKAEATAAGEIASNGVEHIVLKVESTETIVALPKKRTTMLDLLKEWQILACCVATITVTGASGAFEPTLPIHLDEKYNSSSTIIGVVFISIVVPSVIAGPIAGKYTEDERLLTWLAPYGRFGLMIIGSIFAAIATACLGATRNMAGLVVNLAVVGLFSGCAAVPIMSAMGVHVHRMGGGAYAKVYALFNIAYSVGVIIIPTVLPPIMKAIGFAGTMGVTSSILVLGAIVLAINPTRQLLKYGRSAFIGENARTFL